MKKILAGIIALTTVFCAFTGCESKNEEKTDSNEISVETTAENVEETSEDKEEVEESKTDEKVYEDVINEYIDAVNSKDLERAFELQMPDGCKDVAKFNLLQVYADLLEDVESDKKVDELMTQMLGVMPTLTLNKVVSVEELNDDEMDVLKGILAGYIRIADYINKQGGIKNVDMDKFEYGDLEHSDNSDSIKFDDVKYVVFETLEEGEDEPKEEEFYIYRINGGEWHIDNSMVQIVRPTRNESKDSTAKSLKNAANTALVEMDGESALSHMEKVLICSDESKNINVPDDFDVAEFKKKVNIYFEDEEKLDWFIVINEQSAVYVVAVEKEKLQIGTYPVNSVLKSDMNTEGDDSIGSKSFDEVYDMCAEVLK